MAYYHDLITEKSWQVLKTLRKKFDFILIGGWAVFLYTHALKSKDIDVIVEHKELQQLREEFEISKNDRLKKYEARSEEVEVDIYVPFYSNPGLPAEDLKNYVISLEGFTLVEKEILAILKEKALGSRFATPKGKKDLIDLVGLFQLPDFDWEKFRSVIREYKLESELRFIQNEIQSANSIEELDLNVHKMARFKKKILPLLQPISP